MAEVPTTARGLVYGVWCMVEGLCFRLGWAGGRYVAEVATTAGYAPPVAVDPAIWSEKSNLISSPVVPYWFASHVFVDPGLRGRVQGSGVGRGGR